MTPELRPGDRVRLSGLKALHAYNGKYATVVDVAEGPGGKVKVEVEAEVPTTPSPRGSPKAPTQRGVFIKVHRKNCELAAMPAVAPIPVAAAVPATRAQTAAKKVTSPTVLQRGIRAERSVSPKATGPSRAHRDREREKERERGVREWQSLSPAKGPLLGTPLAAAPGRSKPVTASEQREEFHRALVGVTTTDLAMSAQQESSVVKMENEALRAKLTALQRLLHRQEAHINAGMYEVAQSPHRTISQEQHLTLLNRERDRLHRDYEADLETELIKREKEKQTEWKAMQYGFDEQLQALILTYEERLQQAKVQAERAMNEELAKRIDGIRKEFEALFDKKVEEVDRKTDELAKLHAQEITKMQYEVDASKVALSALAEKHQTDIKELEAEHGHALFEAGRRQKEYIRTLQDELTDARAEILTLKIQVQRGNVPRADHKRLNTAHDPPALPPTTTAYVYEDMAFRNNYVALPPGVYNIRDLSLTGVQSVQIPRGWTLLLHEGLNAAGRVRTLKADCVFVSEFNTHASSITINHGSIATANAHAHADATATATPGQPVTPTTTAVILPPSAVTMSPSASPASEAIAAPASAGIGGGAEPRASPPVPDA